VATEAAMGVQVSQPRRERIGTRERRRRLRRPLRAPAHVFQRRPGRTSSQVARVKQFDAFGESCTSVHFLWTQHVYPRRVWNSRLSSRVITGRQELSPEFLATWSSSGQIGSHLTSNREPDDLEGMALVKSINCCKSELHDRHSNIL